MQLLRSSPTTNAATSILNTITPTVHGAVCYSTQFFTVDRTADEHFSVFFSISMVTESSDESRIPSSSLIDITTWESEIKQKDETRDIRNQPSLKGVFAWTAAILRRPFFYDLLGHGGVLRAYYSRGRTSTR